MLWLVETDQESLISSLRSSFLLLADSSTLKAEQQRAILNEGSGPRPITASVEIVFYNKDR